MWILKRLCALLKGAVGHHVLARMGYCSDASRILKHISLHHNMGSTMPSVLQINLPEMFRGMSSSYSMKIYFVRVSAVKSWFGSVICLVPDSNSARALRRGAAPNGGTMVCGELWPRRRVAGGS